jgi:hypothetical protein
VKKVPNGYDQFLTWFGEMIVVWVVFRDMAGKVKCFNGNPHF